MNGDKMYIVRVFAPDTASGKADAVSLRGIIPVRAVVECQSPWEGHAEYGVAVAVIYKLEPGFGQFIPRCRDGVIAGENSVICGPDSIFAAGKTGCRRILYRDGFQLKIGIEGRIAAYWHACCQVGQRKKEALRIRDIYRRIQTVTKLAIPAA